MEMIICPHCKVKVLPTAENICPSCRKSINRNDSGDPKETNPRREATRTRIFFLAGVGLLLAGLMMVFFKFTAQAGDRYNREQNEKKRQMLSEAIAKVDKDLNSEGLSSEEERIRFLKKLSDFDREELDMEMGKLKGSGVSNIRLISMMNIVHATYIGLFISHCEEMERPNNNLIPGAVPKESTRAHAERVECLLKFITGDKSPMKRETHASGNQVVTTETRVSFKSSSKPLNFPVGRDFENLDEGDWRKLKLLGLLHKNLIDQQTAELDKKEIDRRRMMFCLYLVPGFVLLGLHLLLSRRRSKSQNKTIKGVAS